MFEKLRKAFSSAAKNIGQKEISEKDLDNILFDLQLSLLESDVAQEVAEDLSVKLKPKLLGLRVEKEGSIEDLVKSKLQSSVAEMFARSGKLDLVQAIKAKKEAKRGPFVIVFLGINGTGKTTTVAKVAHLLKKSGLSVVLAAGDTHRTGAIEQLTTHAQRLSVKVIAQRYGADPSAVGRDALDYARKHYIDAVLVDTAGRMQTSKNLMDEMSKIVRVVKPDLKIFVGDSLAGNDTVNQAREFFQYANFDGAILTKVDADAKGGAAISLVHITARPITLIGVGQGYDDIIPFDPDKFIESIFGSAPAISVESLMSEPRLVEPEAPEEPQQLAVEPSVPIAVEKHREEEKEQQIAAPFVTAPVEQKKDTTAIFGKMDTTQTDTNMLDAKEQERQSITSDPVLTKESPDEKKVVTEPQQLKQKQELPPPHQVLEEEQQPKEKKRGMFGGLFGGRGRAEKEKEKDRRKEQEEAEEKKRKQKMEEEERERKRQKELEKERKREEEKRRREEEKERQKRERQRAEKKEEEEEEGQLEEDQEEQAGSAVKQEEEKEEGKDQEDKIIYLTDEDIEDLLK
jgi:fused signal recognition particle receptor